MEEKLVGKSLNKLHSYSVIPEDLVRSEVYDQIPMDRYDHNCDGHKSPSLDPKTND
jgi:hypothetical protein